MRRSFLCAVFLLFVFQLSAQTRLQDSIALTNLYNETSGKTWNTTDNWGSGPLDFWHGVTLHKGLVWDIDLSGNNLQGSISASALPSHSFGKLLLPNNHIDAIPSAIKANYIDVSNNKLTYKDLLPYTHMGDSLKYGGQDSVEEVIQVFGQQRGAITLEVLTDSKVSGVEYLWFLNGDSIQGATGSSLTLSCLSADDAGDYTCRISHPDLPSLTLYRRPITLNVLEDEPNGGSDNSVCGSSYTMEGGAPVLGIGKWSLLSGSGTIKNPFDPNTSITDLTAGPNRFAWTVSYKSCELETAVVTITKDTIGELPIAGNDTVICDTVHALNATSAVYGVGKWELVSGSVLFAQATNPKSKISAITPGQHILRWRIDNGACASFFDEVKLTRVVPLASSFAGRDTALCETELFLDATKVPNVSGTWKIIQGKGDIYAPKREDSYVNNLDEGTNVLIWESSNACAEVITDTVNIVIHPFVHVNIGWDTTMYFTPSTPLVLSKNSVSGGTGNYSYSWTPTDFLDNPNTAEGDFNPPDLGQYDFKLVVTDDLGCSDGAEKSIEVIKVITLEIPSLFTPNADGVNDHLVLPGIESYPESDLVIMDQFGQKVYSSKGYQNDWDGIGNNGFYSGKELPEGTYFYMLDLTGDADRIQKGFVVLKRF